MTGVMTGTGIRSPVVWYPDPCPAVEGSESDNMFANRLCGIGAPRPYDHRRYRGCSLGYHLTCSANRSGEEGCECPHHIDHVLDGAANDGGISGVAPAAERLAGLYYLPIFTAHQSILAAIAASWPGHPSDPVEVRAKLCEVHQSPIGPWYTADILSILADCKG